MKFIFSCLDPSPKKGPVSKQPGASKRGGRGSKDAANVEPVRVDLYLLFTYHISCVDIVKEFPTGGANSCSVHTLQG